MRGGGRGLGGRCAICKEFGHWKNECPQRSTEEANHGDDVEKAVKKIRTDKKQKN